MNDLISRKALIDIFQQKADENSELLRNNMLFAKKLVESEPTAYDVNKVVEKLENNCWKDIDGLDLSCIDIDKAIEIVKGGGQSE